MVHPPSLVSRWREAFPPQVQAWRNSETAASTLSRLDILAEARHSEIIILRFRLRGFVRESYAFERLRERAVLSLLPIGREKKAGLSQLSFFEDEVMALSWPAVSSAFGLAVITCVFLYLMIYFRFHMIFQNYNSKSRCCRQV